MSHSTNRLTSRVLGIAGTLALLVVFGLVSSIAQAATTTGQGAAVSAAEPDAKYVLDHFWCYKTQSTPVNEAVQLKDQFNTAFVPAQVGAPDHFCNAVKKKHGDATYNINDPNSHLIFYNIGTATQHLLNVQVDNQFGVQILKVFAPAQELAVPTTIVGSPPPNKLDHFKCYKVKGQGVNQAVGLKDAFAKNPNAIVGKPVLLCNPTAKIHNNVTTEVQHPRAHLVCYKVSETQGATGVLTVNQFRTEQLPIATPDMLCAPSKKKILD